MVIAGYGTSLAGLENVLMATDVGLSLQYLKAEPTVKRPGCKFNRLCLSFGPLFGTMDSV